MAIDLPAQVAHVRFEHACVAAEVVVPHVVEDLSAGQHPTGVDEQVTQQPVLRVRQLDNLAVAPDLVRFVVELEVGERELAVLGLGVAVPDVVMGLRKMVTWSPV